MSGQLWTYLANLNEQEQNRLLLIIKQMMEAESVTEKLKQNDQIAWVQAMNSIHNRAEEIILWELVYGEDEEKLQATFTDEQKELFSRYTDCVREYQTLAEYLLFQNSFKLGARMMVEVMED